eukprot:scpid97439/ scgid2549/ 
MGQWNLVMIIAILAGLHLTSGGPVVSPKVRRSSPSANNSPEEPASVDRQGQVNNTERKLAGERPQCKSGFLYVGNKKVGGTCGPCRYGKRKHLVAEELKVLISIRCCRDIPDKRKKVQHCYVPSKKSVMCSCQCREGRLRPVTFQDYSPKFMYNGATYLKKCTGDYSHLQHDVVK